jgi:hypothetical protein
LPTNIAVAVQLFAVGVGRFETIFVGVVHPLLVLLDMFVQFVLDEPREVQMTSSPA